jgi:hypothetical protein
VQFPTPVQLTPVKKLLVPNATGGLKPPVVALAAAELIEMERPAVKMTTKATTVSGNPARIRAIMPASASTVRRHGLTAKRFGSEAFRFTPFLASDPRDN